MNDRQLQHVNDALAVVTGVLTIAMLARVVLGPDAVNRMRMQILLTTSRTAKQGANTLSTFATKCDTAYHQIRNVSV